MGIPVKVSAAGAVAKGQSYDGEITVKMLPRLAELAQPGKEPLQVRLTADDRSGYSRLHGKVSGEMMLVCQRCDRPFAWPLEAKIDLRLVKTEQQEHDLLSDCDPYVVADDVLPLRELIEDELLLALPMLARCESCENSGYVAPETAQPEAPTRRENPFAALKDKLKH
jgi:uncharacterized protein